MSFVRKLFDLIRTNPVAVGTVVKFALSALVLFGIPVPDGVDVALTAVIVAVVTLIERASVTPNVSLPAPVETEVVDVTGLPVDPLR